MRDHLPLVYMSTESNLKHRAFQAAMERAGISVQVSGKKVESGVSEQPATFDETYQGAMNRHRALKKLGVDAAYYATVESGLHRVHEDHDVYGCNVVVIEPADSAARVGFALDVVFPDEMLARVPSDFPDIGTLVQSEYGASEKDPFPYLTGGRLTRQDTIESAVYNLVIQLDRNEGDI